MIYKLKDLIADWRRIVKLRKK